MKKLLLCCSAVAFSFALVACDLEKTSNQLQANNVMVATVLSTPSVTISPLALAGVDANFFPDFDGGTFEFDGGTDGGEGSFFGDGGLTLPGQTAAVVFFGLRKTQSLDSPPEGITGANVTVTPTDGGVTTLEEDGAGSYSRTSAGDGQFQYVSGADYTITATSRGEAYVGKIERVPPLENITEFHPPKGYIEMAAGSAFTFNRPAAPEGETRPLGFVSVFPVSEDGQKGSETYTNHPKEPLDFLRLIAAPAPWRGSPVTIPGSAFPERGRTYVIMFHAVKTGGPESDNLFTGSALLAGTAEVGVVKTQ